MLQTILQDLPFTTSILNDGPVPTAFKTAIVILILKKKTTF